MIDELTILRLVAVKGRVAPDTIAHSLGADPIEVQAQMDDYSSRGLLKPTPMGYRITPVGRERCTELVATEHQNADAAEVKSIYDDFTERNTELKAIITEWQTRGPGQPNDHSDGEYDAGVLERLQALHRQVRSLLDQIGSAATRLGHYKTRLDKAAAAVAAGDLTFVSKPITDSYHTVWFELHEDLIGLAGLTRAEEAEAGRGA
jgi:pyruvate,orthophosphate dikinase